MKQYIKTFESYHTEYLYHGTSYENAINIIESGLSEKTYWGSRETAEDYAYSYDKPVLIKVSYDELSSLLEPNDTLINYYMESDEEEEKEIYDKWIESDQTIEDSIELFNSVILEPTYLSITKDNVIKLF